MTYLVLARKYRPHSWEDLIGQDHVAGTMKNAIKNNRLAHAYLFCGPRGVGKTSAARILAKSLNCKKSDGEKPCNACTVCKEIEEGRSMDVLEIDGASNRGIEEVRNLRENIKYMPVGGTHRIYIIDEVHMLTLHAFNALLKTLEEPPDHALFIFATTEPFKMPATILSRCQRFDFKRIRNQDIATHLKFICDKENIIIEEEALMLIARKADGGLRDSLSVLDQMIAYAQDKVTLKQVVEGLGLIEQDIYFEVTDAVSGSDAEAALDLAERLVNSGNDIEEFLAGLIEHLRNILIARSAGKADLIDVSENYKKKYMEISSSFDESDLLRLARLAADSRMEIKRSSNPRIMLEIMLVKMIRMDKTVTIASLIEQFNQSGNIKSGRQALIAEPDVPKKNEKQNISAKNANSDQEEMKTLTLEHIKDKWNTVIDKIKHRKITVGSFLQEGVVSGVENSEIIIAFHVKNGFHIDAIKKAKNIVEEVLNEVFGTKLSLKFIKEDLPEKEYVPCGKREKIEKLQNLKQANPMLNKLTDDFDTEICD